MYITHWPVHIGVGRQPSYAGCKRCLLYHMQTLAKTEDHIHRTWTRRAKDGNEELVKMCCLGSRSEYYE